MIVCFVVLVDWGITAAAGAVCCLCSDVVLFSQFLSQLVTQSVSQLYE